MTRSGLLCPKEPIKASDSSFYVPELRSKPIVNLEVSKRQNQATGRLREPNYPACMDGFLEDVLTLQIMTPECENDFAEAIITREYNIAHALLTPTLQLEIPEMMLREKIEHQCCVKAAAHGYNGFHHPIDFVIFRQVSLEQPVQLEADCTFLKLLTIEFYPRSNLEFEVFFELRLVLVAVGESIQIAHLEIE
jgi:hypothetical protein